MAQLLPALTRQSTQQLLMVVAAIHADQVAFRKRDREYKEEFARLLIGLDSVTNTLQQQEAELAAINKTVADHQEQLNKQVQELSSKVTALELLQQTADAAAAQTLRDVKQHQQKIQTQLQTHDAWITTAKAGSKGSSSSAGSNTSAASAAALQLLQSQMKTLQAQMAQARTAPSPADAAVGELKQQVQQLQDQLAGMALPNGGEVVEEARAAAAAEVAEVKRKMVQAAWTTEYQARARQSAWLEIREIVQPSDDKPRAADWTAADLRPVVEKFLTEQLRLQAATAATILQSAQLSVMTPRSRQQQRFTVVMACSTQVHKQTIMRARRDAAAGQGEAAGGMPKVWHHFTRAQGTYFTAHVFEKCRAAQQQRSAAGPQQSAAVRVHVDYLIMVLRARTLGSVGVYEPCTHVSQRWSRTPGLCTSQEQTPVQDPSCTPSCTSLCRLLPADHGFPARHRRSNTYTHLMLPATRFQQPAGVRLLCPARCNLPGSYRQADLSPQ